MIVKETVEMHWLLTLPIDRRVFLLPADTGAIVLFLYLLWRGKPSRLVRSLAVAGLGAAIGLAVVWLVSDVWNVFGLPLTPFVHFWVTVAFSGVFLAVFNLWGGRWWRKTIAAFSILVFLIVAAAGINIDFGAYRNLNDALGISPYSTMSPSLLKSRAGTMDPDLGKTWQGRAGTPKHGTVGMVTIPAPLSKFSARKAVVYLPPAALVSNPPVLPVLVLFAGQPGAPLDIFTSAQIAVTLDAYAAKHNGLAPIVVAPDQLGTPLKNPMCADTKLGKSATYLTKDVPNWIRDHLHVATGARYWAVGGYSQGGTCSIQLGATYPELFGTSIDMLGEVEPTIGVNTLTEVFDGSEAAYDAIKPLYILKRNAPYIDSVAIFGAGIKDNEYGVFVRKVHAAATRAGMKTQLYVSPHSGHDWNTVRYVLEQSLPGVLARFGLER
jgi:enterochelin esterase-like enzyme